ncbi:hypothetical protein TPA0908_32860 [Micromonospora sp. AKA38]|nr:hypothetical protein TPA0908_32860 [Micromonospora sp. AKA38]
MAAGRLGQRRADPATVCDIHPHVEEIETRTADGDLGTLALRRHLGFHPVGRSVRYELALP